MTTKEVTHPASIPAPPVKPTSSQATRRVTPLDLLQSEVARVFDSFNGFGTWPSMFVEQVFSPSMEVTETDSAIEVTAELPGMDDKDIDVSVQDGLLTIRGEKKFEKDEKKKNFRIVERSYGSFERAVALPQGVDPAKVKAHMARGVLKVEIPKPAAAKSQQVKIRAE